MRTEECTNCGARAKVKRGDYEFSESGLPVILRGVELAHCNKCGNVDAIIPRVSQLMRMLTLAVISKPFRLTGEEVRFLRKHLGKTGDDFGKLLDVDKTVLSKWENNAQPIGAQSDRLIRLIVAGLAQGLKKKDMERAVNRLVEINDEARKVSIRMDARKMSYEYAA